MLDSYHSLLGEAQCRNEASDDRNSTENCAYTCKQGLVMRFKALCSQIRAYTKEFFIFFIISLTVLAALKHEQLLTRRTPSPIKLFSPDTYIEDYENGSLTNLVNHVLSSDLSFIMYYAPWDAECIRFKQEFEIVAKHFYRQISFAAINCWWPEGECRQKTFLQRFPSLTAYVQNAGEIGYNGPLVASYIISFLDNIVSPFVPLQEEGQLLDLVSRHDGVVVGYFDFHESPHPSGYDVFFRAAMKSLIDDPWRRVKFAVISSRRVAHKLKIDKPVSITLYSWNSDPKTRSNLHSPESLIKWVHKTLSENHNSLVNWVTPSGHKSDSFLSNFSSGDSFVLLTPRSLILGSSPYYDILREVAMDFYNCENSPLVKSLIMRSILNRRATEEKLMEMEEKCHEILNPSIELSDSPFSSSSRSYDVSAEDSCCHSQIIRWHPLGKSVEKKCYCTACVKIDLSKCPSGCTKFNCLATSGRYLNSFEPSEANRTASFCNEIKSSYHPKYSPHYKIEVTCTGNIPVAVSRPASFSRLSMLDETVSNSKDERIENMMKSFEDRYCARLSVGLNYSEFNFPDSGEGSSNLASQKWRTNFTGLGCRFKKKLKFLAVDSILLPDLAESFGVNIFNETHATAAFIVEQEKKSVYLLNHQLASTCCSSITINKRSIYEMIKNYTEEKLDRFLRSSSSSLISSSGNCLNYNRSEKIVCVPEISSSTFNEIVLSPEKDCVLFYYTPWCGYCSSIAHIYLTLAKTFQNDNNIVFARINNDMNDIPFEFDVDKYPTISFFPAGRSKYQMKIFPSSNAITLPNLMKFVLKNAQLSVRLSILFETCDLKCLVREWFGYRSRYQSIHRNLRNDLHSLTFLRLQIMSRRRSKSDLLKPYLKIFAQRLRESRFSLSILPLVRFVLHEKLTNHVPSAAVEPEIRKIITKVIRNLKLSKKNRKGKKMSHAIHHEEL